jgi:hypothetical protein
MSPPSAAICASLRNSITTKAACPKALPSKALQAIYLQNHNGQGFSDRHAADPYQAKLYTEHSTKITTTVWITLSCNIQNQSAPSSDQHLPGVRKEIMNLRLDARINHHRRAFANRARHSRSRTKKPTDQGPLGIHRAALWPQMRTRQRLKRSLMYRITHTRQTRHFLTGSRNRPAAIMAARLTFKGRNAFAEKADFLAIGIQSKALKSGSGG